MRWLNCYYYPLPARGLLSSHHSQIRDMGGMCGQEIRHVKYVDGGSIWHKKRKADTLGIGSINPTYSNL